MIFEHLKSFFPICPFSHMGCLLGFCSPRFSTRQTGRGAYRRRASRFSIRGMGEPRICYRISLYRLVRYSIPDAAIFDKETPAVPFFGRDGCFGYRPIGRAWSKGILTCFHKLLAFANPALFRYPSEPDEYIIPESGNHVDSQRKSVAELLPDDSEQDEGDDDNRRCRDERQEQPNCGLQ